MSAGTVESPYDGYGPMTTPLRSTDSAPPPWLRRSADDPRRSSCTHDWDDSWGSVGERQHLCTHCVRWIWEHSIRAAVSTQETTE